MNRLADALFVVVDCETTGLDPRVDGVVEVAFVAATWRYLLAGSSTLINPGRPIPPEASAIHHLSDADVASAPSLEEGLRRMGALASPDRCFVAHNAAFDSAFLPMLPGPWVCTLRLARHLLPGLPQHGNQYLRYVLGLRVPEAEGRAAHRAEADALVTAHLLHHLFSLLPPEVQTVEQLLVFQDRPCLLRTCHMGAHRNQPWSDVPKDYLRWFRGSDLWTRCDADVQYTVEHWLGVEAC